MKEKFIEFLKAHRALLAFKRNLAAAFKKDKNYDIILDVYCEGWTSSGYIIFAFDWDKTLQGYEYWKELNAEWFKELGL